MIWVGDYIVNEFHAAGFARAVFAVAVGAEAIPFPVAAGVHDLVEETHGAWVG